jgi:hypothetical protein
VCVPKIARNPLPKAVTAVTTMTVVTVPEAGKSEISVDIKTVTTMPLMTIKCKGSLEAVRHPLFGTER